MNITQLFTLILSCLVLQTTSQFLSKSIRFDPFSSFFPQVQNKIIGEWNITNINGKAVNVPATIDQNAISFSYCDQMSYPYISMRNLINITSNWTRQVACCRMSNGLFQDEVNDTFTGAKSFTLNGNILILMNANGEEVVRMQKDNTDISSVKQSIEGEWTATQVRGKTVNVNVTIKDSKISYRYCNTKSMGYSTNQGLITVTPGISTMMACMGMNPSESEFDSAFYSASRYQRTSDQIRFYDQKGILTAVLQSKNCVPITSPPIISTPITSFPIFTESPKIVGTWQTSMVNNKALIFNVNITSTTISFSYCNSFSFPYSVVGSRISLKTPIQTKMYCADMNPPESFVSNAFSSAFTFSICPTTGALIFYNSVGKQIVRMRSLSKTKYPTWLETPITAPVSQSIAGSWFTTDVNGNKVTIKVTITQNTIRYTYCNGKSLSYKLNGNDIEISPGASTMMYCQMKPSEGEVDYAFTSAVNFKLSDNQLYLIDKLGRTVVTLEKNEIMKITPIRSDISLY